MIKLINERYCPYVGEEVREFICDTEEDIADLPTCCPQSTALVCSTGNVYIVNASGEWVKFGQEESSMATQHLYRHDLTVHDSDLSYLVSFTIFSTNASKIESWEDLRSVLPEGNSIMASGKTGDFNAISFRIDSDADCLICHTDDDEHSYDVIDDFFIRGYSPIQIF